MKELAVIIVTYNSEPDIYACLDALFAHNDIGDALEVIVVDNNSDNYAHMKDEIAHLYGEQVQIVHNTKNGGYGQGNNRGIKQASAPIIMIMNPDVKLVQMSFRKIVELYKTDKRLALCGFKQIINDMGKRGTSFSLLNHYHGLVRWGGGILAKRLDLYVWRWMYFCGACFCVRKEMLINAGGFDESIFMYGEENDIHYRIHQTYSHAHDKYVRNFVYLHPTENRPRSQEADNLRIKSNEYVMQKQGRPTGTYIRSEEQRLRWSRLIK